MSKSESTAKKKNTEKKETAAGKNNKIKILYATSECVPFANSGGLGEVAGSLPRALNRKRDIECRVIMPLYGAVSEEFREKMRFLGSTGVGVTWRMQYMGLFELRYKGVTYYFVDNEYYFKRDGLYGHYDDGERFAFFSKAIFEALGMMDDFVPDIIHANDWQTALVPVYQTSIYKREFMKTVFSIHNVEYQGYYGDTAIEDFIGIPDNYSHVLEFKGGTNLMKGAIETANAVSTVSPTYAMELKDPFFAFGMQDIIGRNSHKLSGILNGINTVLYDPAKDPMIEANYSAGDLSGKKECKRALQKQLSLPETDSMMIAMISRLVPAKGVDLLSPILDDIIANNDVQFVLLGTGYPEYEYYFRGIEARHPDKARCLIQFDSALSHKLYAGADALLVPSRSEPCGLTQMIGCRYACVPIVRRTGGLADSIKDCTLGDGNGFVFDDYSPDGLYAAIMNAYSTYSRPEDWKKLAEHDLRCDFGWSGSANTYRELYRELTQNA